MPIDRNASPPPDLRIVQLSSLFPHEEHDSQRALPLIERLKEETVVINPPVVSPMGASQFVILDGANRFYALSELGYQHILIQVTPYDGGYVELSTWRHLVCDWNEHDFLYRLRSLSDIEVAEGQHPDAIAHVVLRDHHVIALRAPVHTTSEQNAVLREIVALYQKNAILERTALSEPEDIWPLHPSAIALVVFPEYRPSDIVSAARYRAFLPPGISRHIIHGRALRVNFPLEALREPERKLRDKNLDLQAWMRRKLEARQVRYYAEATFMFDE